MLMGIRYMILLNWAVACCSVINVVQRLWVVSTHTQISYYAIISYHVYISTRCWMIISLLWVELAFDNCLSPRSSWRKWQGDRGIPVADQGSTGACPQNPWWYRNPCAFRSTTSKGKPMSWWVWGTMCATWLWIQVCWSESKGRTRCTFPSLPKDSKNITT